MATANPLPHSSGDGDVGQLGRNLAQHISSAHHAAHRYLTLLRFGLLNLAALALLTAAAAQGWIAQLVQGDQTHLIKLIGLVFVIGLGQCAHRARQLSLELNQARTALPDPSSRAGRYLSDTAGLSASARANLAATLKLKLGTRLQGLRYTANLLILLGLIGTVVGFIIALSGVNPETVSDVNAIGPTVSTLLAGMAVALHTTLVGSVLNIWLMLNCRLIEGASVHLYTSIVEAGERHARA